ncbi:MAG: hypothetical protein LBS52_07355 [Dysgonamonadaceae bacterium]|nr:hypothetical protein [Dysgonamonadaceae bacterium]
MNRKKNHIIHKILLASLFLLSGLGAQAQKASVQASVEPAEILIGEQALINLKIIAPKDKTILFPIYESQIVPGLEVLAMPSLDTLIENNVMTLNVKYLVTSFDSTLYHIPSMPISDGTDTIYSNSFGLKVTSPALKDSTLAYLEKMNTGQTDSIDFNQLQLNDIKPIQKPPFVLADYLWVLWIFLGVLLLLLIVGLAVYLILKRKKKGYFFTPPVVLPPHIRAIQALDKLKEEKNWQQGREKEFYTKITDILRQYIFDRYRISAMEMTSGEILNEIRKETDVASVYENLKQILSVSDLVKFAKYKPFADENDLSMMNAYFFVNQTREPDPVPKKDEAAAAEQETEEEEESNPLKK